ncbi:MAG: PhoH-like ATPase [Rhodothermales bacterium]
MKERNSPVATEKLFVLDTNVLLHDSASILQFGPHDVAIPITVLEELDNFKKGHDTINYHARDAMRRLDTLSGDAIFNGGVALGDGHGRLRVLLPREYDADLSLNFPSNKPDHLILNAAYQLHKSMADTQVILVSKDVNVRMKAKALGMVGQDYRSDQVSDIDTLYTGWRTIEDVPHEVITALYEPPNRLPAKDLEMDPAPRPNEYYVLRGANHSALARFNPGTQEIEHVVSPSASGITPRNAEQSFALDALLDPRIELVTIAGKAGTGKTLLALAAALQQHLVYQQTFLARPIIPLGNRDLGFLPGDVKSKLDPYMQPLYDNLAVIRRQFRPGTDQDRWLRELEADERLVISPLAYIRGRSLVNIFFIVDEAQNLTPHEVKTIITRAGDGTKVVFTGDIFQIDHPYLDSQSNGLSYLIERMQGQSVHAHITMVKGERSHLSELASDML